MSMFCYQCEQTANGTACTKIGVCGKDKDIQSLQDTLVFGLMGVAAYAYHARELGKTDTEISAFMEEALFPRLEAHGIVEPTQICKEDHVEFMAKKKEHLRWQREK